jgi:hypothetical protein
MKTCINGKIREMTADELSAMDAERSEAERRYFLETPYDEAVNTEIRKRYSVSQEFAILRQRDEKPDEYAAYFAYCEECKAYVKRQKAKYE